MSITRLAHRPGRRDAEGVVLDERRVLEHALERPRRPRLVVAPDVDDVERVRGRRHVVELELGDRRHGLEDRAELLREALDLLLGQREARESRDVQHLFPVDRHLVILQKSFEGGGRGETGSQNRAPFGARRLTAVPEKG